jgi:FKBP12-rapamycin complex-associated protein
MEHILFVLKTPDERASGFVALGEMAGALGAELVPSLPSITPLLHEAVCFRTHFILWCSLYLYFP